MTREEAIAYGKRVIDLGLNDETQAFCQMAIKALEQEPCGETVSLEAFKQVMWERDIAIEQLKELGYGFGQKIEPKTGHCKECKYFEYDSVEKVDGVPLIVAHESGWIPVSERLPEDLEHVNITWVNHNPKSYYADIKDKPFTETGIYFNGQWYWWSTLCADTLAEYGHNYDDVIDDDIEIIAWQPLPEPYKPESEGDDNGTD